MLFTIYKVIENNFWLWLKLDYEQNCHFFYYIKEEIKPLHGYKQYKKI